MDMLFTTMVFTTHGADHTLLTIIIKVSSPLRPLP